MAAAGTSTAEVIEKKITVLVVCVREAEIGNFLRRANKEENGEQEWSDERITEWNSQSKFELKFKTTTGNIKFVIIKALTQLIVGTKDQHRIFQTADAGIVFYNPSKPSTKHLLKQRIRDMQRKFGQLVVVAEDGVHTRRYARAPPEEEDDEIIPPRTVPEGILTFNVAKRGDARQPFIQIARMLFSDNSIQLSVREGTPRPGPQYKRRFSTIRASQLHRPDRPIKEEDEEKENEDGEKKETEVEEAPQTEDEAPVLKKPSDRAKRQKRRR